MTTFLAAGMVAGIIAAPLLADAFESHVAAIPPAFDALEAFNDLDPIAELPDLRGVPAGPKRKAAFLNLLVPLVEAENARIAAKRDWLMAAQERDLTLDEAERERLAELCESYRLECRGQGIDERLLRRVDTLPLELVVIQAVEESGWGTSRFARQGNNLFGIRCFSDDCGLGQQGSGRRYQAFDSVQEAVRSYMHNLNTHRAYERLRVARANMASQGAVSAEALIDTLDNYAVRADYQDVLLALLRTNSELIRRHRSDDTA
ncbi:MULTISPECIES: glucosaminidase domain-containing protein [Halomonadaceae]|uniref:glucosaminidase domain-containing protein n=1 Tax=Halomonadaceae TaxID=28256 RepID=UPI00200D3B15|nr:MULTISPECIES: glucosaminidase domain-containing protein [Halomonas]